jgi:hypothetical protein
MRQQKNRGEVPNMRFWLRNRGGNPAKDREYPHVQRVKSKFGTRGAEVRSSGAGVQLIAGQEG